VAVSCLFFGKYHVFYEDFVLIFAIHFYYIYHLLHFVTDIFFSKLISWQTYVYFHKNQRIRWLYYNCELYHNYGIHLCLCYLSCRVFHNKEGILLMVVVILDHRTDNLYIPFWSFHCVFLYCNSLLICYNKFSQNQNLSIEKNLETIFHPKIENPWGWTLTWLAWLTQLILWLDWLDWLNFLDWLILWLDWLVSHDWLELIYYRFRFLFLYDYTIWSST